MTTKKPLTMSKEEWVSMTDALPGEDSPPPPIKSSSHHAALDLSAATTHPHKMSGIQHIITESLSSIVS